MVISLDWAKPPSRLIPNAIVAARTCPTHSALGAHPTAYIRRNAYHHARPQAPDIWATPDDFPGQLVAEDTPRSRRDTMMAIDEDAQVGAPDSCRIDSQQRLPWAGARSVNLPVACAADIAEERRSHGSRPGLFGRIKRQGLRLRGADGMDAVHHSLRCGERHAEPRSCACTIPERSRANHAHRPGHVTFSLQRMSARFTVRFLRFAALPFGSGCCLARIRPAVAAQQTSARPVAGQPQGRPIETPTRPDSQRRGRPTSARQRPCVHVRAPCGCCRARAYSSAKPGHGGSRQACLLPRDSYEMR